MPTSDPTTPPPALPRINRIAILGGGPSGLTCLSRLLRFRPTHFPTIHLFEQRSRPGGIWNATPKHTLSVSDDPQLFIPLTSPSSPGARVQEGPLPDDEVCSNGDGEGGGKLFVSAVYPNLVANIPKQLMAFHDFPFADEEALFPRWQAVREYLLRYAEKVEREAKESVKCRIEGSEEDKSCQEREGEGDKGRCIFYNKKVDQVERLPGGGWRVEVVDLRTGERWDGMQEKKEGEDGYAVGGRYDAVVIASGRYTVPYVPDIPGLREFVESGRGRVEHSRDFRGGEEYAGKTVLLVGSSVSAGDLSRLLLPHVCHPLYQSTKQPLTLNATVPSPTSPHPTSNPFPSIHLVPEISHLTFDDNGCTTVHFYPPTTPSTNPSTTIPSPPPALTLTLPPGSIILLCTGYLLTYPYISSPSFTQANLPHPLAGKPEGSHVSPLIHQTIFAPDPTLVFLGLPYKVIPFIITAAQAAVVARLWAGKITLEEVAGFSSGRGDGSLRDGNRNGIVNGSNGGVDQADKTSGSSDPSPGRGHTPPSLSTSPTSSIGKHLHRFGYPKDADYTDLLSAICHFSDTREPSPSPLPSYHGDYPIWTSWHRWLRKSATGEIRTRYFSRLAELQESTISRPPKRCWDEACAEDDQRPGRRAVNGASGNVVVRTIEELGLYFDEEEWRGREEHLRKVLERLSIESLE